MFFNVSQLLKEPTGFTRAFTVDEIIPLQESGNDSRIFGDVRMLRTDKGIWVEAKLSSDINCSCSRCLVDFDQPIKIDMQEEFLPRVDVDTGARLNNPSEYDEDFYIRENHILDLTDAAIQYLEMTTPMKPVCTEQCKGICLTCGVDLNEQACRCQVDRLDPRWGSLADWATIGAPYAN